MTSLRKWRFPILIGSGLIAAGILFYFSKTHVSPDKTQGAIGQRDVYRDGQVNSADVAKPGSSPVATTAILESSEFKSLAKNPAFQELLREDAFNGSHKKAFADLLADSHFRDAVQDVRFAALVQSSAFQLALRSHADLYSALKDEAMFKAMDSNGLRLLLKTDLFLQLAHEQAFNALIASSALRENLRSEAFVSLLSRSDFSSQLIHGSSSVDVR
jgi:hypothetical protein